VYVFNSATILTIFVQLVKVNFVVNITKKKRSDHLQVVIIVADMFLVSNYSLRAHYYDFV